MDINCQPKLTKQIVPYAYWVHTHEIGQVVSGYKIDNASRKPIEFARWTHRWPQPVTINQNLSSVVSIFPGDYVAGRCTYNSTLHDQPIKWGPRKMFDEMCNLFLFYFTSIDNFDPEDLFITCVNQNFKEITNILPKEANILPNIPHTKLLKKLNSFNINSTTNNTICNLYLKFGIKKCPFD